MTRIKVLAELIPGETHLPQEGRPRGAPDGPTGSGKSTAVYALIREIGAAAVGARRIASMEDPVEVVLPGVAQLQAGFDWHSGIVQFAFVDGSTRAITASAELGVLEKLANRNDGVLVDSGEF